MTTDTGQIETYTASWVGGLPPYTANFPISNSLGICINRFQTGLFLQSVVSTNVVGGACGTGTLFANVLITNSQGETTTNSLIRINNPAQIANILLESNTIINGGGSSILTAGVVGGTPSYHFNWFNQANCNGPSFASGTTTVVTPPQNAIYSFNVVNSASTNNVICSASNSIIVRATSLICTAPSFNQGLISNAININLDTRNTINVYLTTNNINGNTIVFLNGTQIETIQSGQGGGPFIVPPLWSLTILYVNNPGIAFQCVATQTINVPPLSPLTFYFTNPISLGEILAILSAIFLAIRLVMFKEKSPQMLFLIGLAMILMAFSAYFISFPFVNSVAQTTITKNLTTNVITPTATLTNATSSFHPTVGQIPTVFLLMMVYEIICRPCPLRGRQLHGPQLFKP